MYIQIVISGVSGIILLAYIIFESIFFYYEKCTFLQVLLVNINLKKRITKITPIYWEIDKISNLCSINRPFMKYRVWVTFKGKVDTTDDVQSWLSLDRLGRIENVEIIKEEFEELIKKIPKENKRDSLLEKLGI
jgi:hypothetical protein